MTVTGKQRAVRLAKYGSRRVTRRVTVTSTPISVTLVLAVPGVSSPQAKTSMSASTSGSPSKSKSNATAGQTVISSYFSQVPSAQSSPARRHARQRSDSPIDLTQDDGDVPPAKKRKTVGDVVASQTPSRLNAAQTSQRSRGAAVVEQYRLGSQVSSQPRSPDKESERRERHEKAKRILLSGSNILDRSTQQDDDDAQADTDDEHVDSADKVTASAEDVEEDPDAKFENMMALFANSGSRSKSKRGKKQNSVAAGPSRPSKKVQEIGPSGEPYTPLELQVNYISHGDLT